MNDPKPASPGQFDRWQRYKFVAIFLFLILFMSHGSTGAFGQPAYNAMAVGIALAITIFLSLVWYLRFPLTQLEQVDVSLFHVRALSSGPKTNEDCAPDSKNDIIILARIPLCSVNQLPGQFILISFPELGATLYHPFSIVRSALHVSSQHASSNTAITQRTSQFALHIKATAVSSATTTTTTTTTTAKASSSLDEEQKEDNDDGASEEKREWGESWTNKLAQLVFENTNKLHDSFPSVGAACWPIHNESESENLLPIRASIRGPFSGPITNAMANAQIDKRSMIVLVSFGLGLPPVLDVFYWLLDQPDFSARIKAGLRVVFLFGAPRDNEWVRRVFAEMRERLERLRRIARQGDVSHHQALQNQLYVRFIISKGRSTPPFPVHPMWHDKSTVKAAVKEKKSAVETENAAQQAAREWWGQPDPLTVEQDRNERKKKAKTEWEQDGKVWGVQEDKAWDEKEQNPKQPKLVPKTSVYLVPADFEIPLTTFAKDLVVPATANSVAPILFIGCSGPETRKLVIGARDALSKSTDQSIQFVEED